MHKNLKLYIKTVWRKYVNRETITYSIAGIMTTVVNFVTYYILCNRLGIENLIANTVSWIIAVSFAYIINDLWVFQSEKESITKNCLKIVKFFGARILSFVVEQFGMFLFINLFKFNNIIVKAFLTVIVIVLNYLLSKTYIFKNKKDRCME